MPKHHDASPDLVTPQQSSEFQTSPVRIRVVLSWKQRHITRNLKILKFMPVLINISDAAQARNAATSLSMLHSRRQDKLPVKVLFSGNVEAERDSTQGIPLENQAGLAARRRRALWRVVPFLITITVIICSNVLFEPGYELLLAILERTLVRLAKLLVRGEPSCQKCREGKIRVTAPAQGGEPSAGHPCDAGKSLVGRWLQAWGMC